MSGCRRSAKGKSWKNIREIRPGDLAKGSRPILHLVHHPAISVETKTLECASEADLIKQKKLEIWGKAQRESARRPKSDWGKIGGRGVKRRVRIFPASKSRGPNSNVSAYAERALST